MAKTAKKPASIIETIKQANASNEEFIIRIGVGRPPRAMCSCGWDTPPNSNLLELGTAAFQHRDDTGHQLRKPPEDELD